MIWRTAGNGQQTELEALMLNRIERAGLPPPQLEHRFAEPRRWRLDFYWPAQRVALEVEGGTHVHGRHVRGAGFEADCEKYAEALIRGIRVLRVTGRMVRDGRALFYLERLLRKECP